MVFDAHVTVTPVGNPVAVPIPVAPVVVWVIDVKAVLIHNGAEPDAADTVLIGSTIILPVAFTALQPPVKGII